MTDPAVPAGPTPAGQRPAVRSRAGTDLRLPVLGAAAWLGALAGTLGAWRGVLGVVVAAVVLVAACRRWRRRWLATALASALVGATGAGIAEVRLAEVAHGPLAALAADGAVVTASGTVRSDPAPIAGAFGDEEIWRLDVRRVTGRGRSIRLAAPVLVIAPADDDHDQDHDDDGHDGGGAGGPALGARVRVVGRLARSDGRDLAAVLLPAGSVVVEQAPGPWWRAAAVVRRGMRDSVAGRPPDQRALVPALVDGDDGDVPVDLQDDFRTTGLTHLLAVSGTNLTLLVGFVMLLARWTGVRGRWLVGVGALGVVGFVVVARAEPSVVRAAVMGTVGLIAMGSNGRQRALRALGLAVLLLMLLDPGLAVSVGFTLSALATAGILLLAPAWRDAMARWLPRWAAEAIAVPAAAQLACTPVVAALSGQVSLVAVLANLLTAPAVGPATILGLLGGLVTLVWPTGGHLLGMLASWCVAWLIAVARHGAALPSAALDWGTGPAALVGLTLLSLAVALLAPRVLRRPVTGVPAVAVLLLVVLVRVPRLGWPPDDWVMVACDVGQGDGLVLNAGPGAAVVVDAGPDPAAMSRCLDRLGVRAVPLLLLTHFHADHVDGIDGVLHGRRVGAIETTRLRDPPAGVEEVDEAASSTGVRAVPAPYGETVRYGAVTLEPLWPLPDSPVQGPGDGSTANEASVVLLVQIRGVRLLLTGDVDPEGQQVLARTLPGLHVDVLKMPHHGSRYQDEPWLESLDPALVLVSVGADNDYGQPAASSLDPLAATGARVLRTDQHGDLAVVAPAGGHGTVGAVTQR